MGKNKNLYIKLRILLETHHRICQYVPPLQRFDASAAFDRVWHAGLLFKRRMKAITGTLLSWFESYLTERFQMVVIKGEFSESNGHDFLLVFPKDLSWIHSYFLLI